MSYCQGCADLSEKLDEARRRIATLTEDRAHWAQLTGEAATRRIEETKRAERAERERDEARREMKRLREEVRTTLLAEEERRKLTGDALAAEADAKRLREALLRARKMLGSHSLHADAEGFAIIGAALAAAEEETDRG